MLSLTLFIDFVGKLYGIESNFWSACNEFPIGIFYNTTYTSYVVN